MAKYRFEEFAINSTAKKKPVEEDKYTYLGLEHLDSGTLKVTRFGSEVAPIGEKLIMKKGDILFGKRRAYQKKVAIAPFDGIFSAHGMVLRPNEKVMDKDFFPLFISSDYFLDAAIKISVGSLSPTINWGDLKVLEFVLPSLEEQCKLAKVLWAMNDTMESYKKLIRMTDELVKSQFVEMFGVPNQNTKNWDVVKLGELCDLKNGYAFKSTDYVEISGVYNCRMSNIRPDGSFDIEYNPKYLPEEFANKYLEYRLYDGNVVIAMTDMAGDPKILGVPTIVKTKGRILLLNQRVGRLDFYNQDKMNEIFVRYYLARSEVRQELLKGATKGLQVNVGKDAILNLEIFCPPIELQLQFIDFVQQSDKSKLDLEQALAELTATYKGIIAENLD